VTPRQSLLVRMGNVYQSCGCVILITIVETTAMNRPTCADRRIARQDGRDVQDEVITDAFQNGCSVMEKTTVGTDPTKNLKTVPNVWIQTLNVLIVDVFPSKYQSTYLV